jgi:hypothetical protein
MYLCAVWQGCDAIEVVVFQVLLWAAVLHARARLQHMLAACVVSSGVGVAIRDAMLPCKQMCGRNTTATVRTLGMT